MGDVINIVDNLRKKSKARDALVEILNSEFPQELDDVDWIISALWSKGFVIAHRNDGGGDDAA